jgi:hypothetical protein
VNAITNYLDKFGSNFLVASMIPSLGLVIACILVFDPIFQVSSTFQNENGIYSLLGISLLVTIPTVIVGYTLTALNTFILKFFEGYVFFHRFHFMRRGQARQANKLIKQREILRDQIQQLAQKRKLSREEKMILDTLKTTYYSIVTTYDLSYPPPHAGIMPTKFGNILKASEAYPGTRYGIDAVQFWPRLWHVIPTSYQHTIENARNELSFLVNMSALSVVFFFFCIIAILLNTPSPNSFVFDEFLLSSIRYILAAALAVLSNRFFNRAALLSVGEFGMMIRSAYDLFRLDLLEQFRVKLPKNLDKEYQVWENLGQLISLGEEAIEFKGLTYEKKAQKLIKKPAS